MNLIKKTIATLATITALAGPVAGQTSGSIEAIKSTETSQTYIRPTLNKKLTEDIGVNTFAEFYEDGTYFGKTTATTKLDELGGIKAQGVYGTNVPTTMGIGAYVTIPTPEKTSASISYMPLWVDGEGKSAEKNVLAYYVSIGLPLDLKLSSFGELDTKTMKWMYGEIGLEKKITDDLSVSYQPALKGTRGPIPELEHRLDLKYKL